MFVMQINNIARLAKPILSSFGIKKAALFGSYASGHQSEDSDYDILVELGKKMSLLEFIGLKQDLEEVLEKKVDLVQYKQIKSSLKNYILGSEQVFYQACTTTQR